MWRGGWEMIEEVMTPSEKPAGSQYGITPLNSSNTLLNIWLCWRQLAEQPASRSSQRLSILDPLIIFSSSPSTAYQNTWGPEKRFYNREVHAKRIPFVSHTKRTGRTSDGEISILPSPLHSLLIFPAFEKTMLCSASLLFFILWDEAEKKTKLDKMAEKRE